MPPPNMWDGMASGLAVPFAEVHKEMERVLAVLEYGEEHQSGEHNMVHLP